MLALYSKCGLCTVQYVRLTFNSSTLCFSRALMKSHNPTYGETSSSPE